MAITPAQMLALISKAAVDPAFKTALMQDPYAASRGVGAPMDDNDVRELQKIFDDLQRFGGDEELHPDDAKSWAFGVCQVREVRVRIDSWPPDYAMTLAMLQSKTSPKNAGAKAKAK